MFKTIALLSTLLFSTIAFAADVIKFSEDGAIVNIHQFFSSLKVSKIKALHANTSGKALVTKTGIYAFLESPANDTHLKDFAPGTTVKILGKLHKKSFLLHIESISKSTVKLDAEIKKYKASTGKTISIKGMNMCQCGLTLGSLPHSCKLGHIHHMQGNDKTIYHYLQSSKDHSLNKNHFKAMKIKALLFPGNWIFVK
ncbi:MAG: hypothetical protein HRT89_21470 [Lentisphaeria bacterium]|nr:hypothetical protein [Lentisphaeria bacterium]NQZ70632.1 hypothetical protein [Lentisphaeria bacterium]